MAMANRILRVAAPQIAPPVAVREGDSPPEVVVGCRPTSWAGIAEAVRELQGELGEAGDRGRQPRILVDDVTAALTDAGIAFGVATRRGLRPTSASFRSTSPRASSSTASCWSSRPASSPRSARACGRSTSP